MGIILDIVLIAIIALNVFICYKKGLVKLAVGLIAVAAAIILALVFYKPVSNLIIENTELDENIELEKAFMNWGKLLYKRLDRGRYYWLSKNVDIDEFNKIGKKLKFKLQRYLPYNVVVEYENKARV